MRKKKTYIHFVDIGNEGFSLYREHNKRLEIYSIENSVEWSSSVMNDIQDVVRIGRGYWIENKLIEVMYEKVLSL